MQLMGDIVADSTIATPEIPWTDTECPVARTLDLVGDRWSLLIIRDAMSGARSFSEFQRRTGIARNILTDRLRRLVARGVLVRQTAPSGRRQNYALSDSGADLFAVITALRQWGERHAFRQDEPHSVMVDERNDPVPDLVVLDSAGKALSAGNTRVVGPS